jgi:diacylglycerol kinase family enzyme
VVTGDDAALAAAVAAQPGAVVRFDPDPTSDLARALGLANSTSAGTAAPLDALRLDGALAVNMVVSGVAPSRLRTWHRRRTCTVEVDDRQVFEGRATTVVVANGQFLDGLDVVPRGHPGDGRFEVQVYGIAPAQRRAMRRRLGTGTHVPHPEVHAFQGRSVRVTWDAATALQIDGRSGPPMADVAVSLEPHAFSVLL